MLRLMPLAVAVHLVAVAVLLTLRLAPRPIAEEPPPVVFLRALPPARPAGAPAASAPVAQKSPPKARVTPRKRELRAPVVPPKEMPPEQPPPPVAAVTESLTAESASSALASGPGAPAHGGSGGLGVTGDAPVGLGEITRPPAILYSPRPQYPSAAKSMGITGRVLVRVIVDVAGRVEAGSAKVLRSVPALDGAALAAIVQWRFSSSVDRSGRPVRVTLDIPVEFSLR